MEFEITIAIGVALIVGIVQGAKQWKVFEGRNSFLLSMLLGQLMGIFYFAGGDIRTGVWIGLGMGLAASGLYSGGKSILEKKED